MGESILALLSSSMISIHDMVGEGVDSDSSWSDVELRSWRLPDIFKCCSTLFCLVTLIRLLGTLSQRVSLEWNNNVARRPHATGVNLVSTN